MKYVFTFLAVLAFTTSFGQDEKSQAILDKLSTKMKGMTSFYIEFSANIKNTTTGTNSTETGKGWVKGEKFTASYGENTIVSNGKKTWTMQVKKSTLVSLLKIFKR